MPEFLKDEAELREIWSDPETRRKLLDGLAEKGSGSDQLAEMRLILTELHRLVGSLDLDRQIVTDEKLVSGHISFHVGRLQSELVIEQPARPDVGGGAVAS